MALRPDQIERLRSRFPTLAVHPSCILIDSHFDEHVTLAENVAVANCRIGAHSVIGTNAQLRAARVGNRVRIGRNARVHPGVTIGNDAIIEADSIVTADIDPAAYAPSPDPDNHLPLQQFLLEKLPLHVVYQKWRAVAGGGGDNTLRLDYPLNPGDRVLDVGGYLGDFAHEILVRHDVGINVFEPVASFANHLRVRFAEEKRVSVHEFGLAGATRSEQIAIASESSSILRDFATAATQSIRLVAAKEFLDGLDGDIALLKINIEGCEYELLEHLLDENLFARVRYLQVQFHDFVPGARDRRRQLRERLARTHREQWNYPFIWESWERKGSHDAAAS
jgi:FkbM family methyltransferase